MKNLVKSVMSSSSILVSYILYAYFGIIREAVKNGGFELLWKGYTQQGRSILLLNILYSVIFIPVAINFWDKTLLPIIEVLLLKNVVSKRTTFVVCDTVKSIEYLPWVTITKVRLPGERGVFVFPCKLDDSTCISTVLVRYLPKSGLILNILS